MEVSPSACSLHRNVLPGRPLPLLCALLLALAGCEDPGAAAGATAESGRADEAADSSKSAPATPELEPHPDFAMTQTELETLTADAPAATRAAVAEKPQYFLELAARLLELPPVQLRLVDKEHALPSDTVPDDRLVLDRYEQVLTLNRSGLTLRAVLIPDLLAMAEAARQAGILLPISSTYRSYEYQAGLFERHVENLGEEQASRVSARPGTSQHQLGTALDFGSITLEFADTAAGEWLAAHAGDYGFSMSYPNGYEELTGYSYEPWHFRWIGRTATEMEAVFFDDLQQHMLEFWNEHEAEFRRKLR
ncbi:MAG: D-alanyl-D-alanine carboxypeptidase family protein [Spirochaetes bacterium]|jgi:D-alanyl-D-alanine carboxypeptidase|nr:D-alanyl-D-alanine carboxypeptidase family protein [Spirochaetota bacterium]